MGRLKRLYYLMNLFQYLGRPRRKAQNLFTVKTAKNVIYSKPEQFVNLVGVVDSEGSENDMEFN